jgi:hypothetical protein
LNSPARRSSFRAAQNKAVENQREARKTRVKPGNQGAGAGGTLLAILHETRVLAAPGTALLRVPGLAFA